MQHSTWDQQKMIKKTIAAVAAALLLLSVGMTALAQDGDTISPVETFTCNYNDGKGPADLEKATAAWNKWMDDEGDDTYGALTLSPWYHGADTFDVGWLGYWNDGASMGAGTDKYLTEGGQLAEGFADAVTCDTHSNFASMMIKSPGDDEPPPGLVVYFSDCNIEDGADWGSVRQGLGAWADYMTEQEYNNGLWVLFQAFGSGEEDFDFKSVTTYENHAAAGAAYDKYGNGGGWQKRRELLGNLLDCNVSRVYNGTFQRTPAPPAE